MRKVERDWNDKPDILISTDTLSALETIATTKNKDLISDKIYKDSYKDKNGVTQSRVRDKLNKYYYCKCAYCETYCKAEIEHYRPKKGVSRLPAHNGYYWLAYEWSNLLPSCRNCNTEGGKGNQFPIETEASRVYNPSFDSIGNLDKNDCLANQSPLIDEKPYLLHPEIDDPKNHLGFQLNKNKEGIDIVAIDTDSNLISRGSETIKILNLNRLDLRLKRFGSIISSIREYINYIFKLRKDNIIQSDSDLEKALLGFYAKLEENSNNIKKEYTLLSWFITSSIDSFNKIVCSVISDINQKEIVLETFKKYKKRLR